MKNNDIHKPISPLFYLKKKNGTSFNFLQSHHFRNEKSNKINKKKTLGNNNTYFRDKDFTNSLLDINFNNNPRTFKKDRDSIRTKNIPLYAYSCKNNIDIKETIFPEINSNHIKTQNNPVENNNNFEYISNYTEGNKQPINFDLRNEIIQTTNNLIKRINTDSILKEKLVSDDNLNKNQSKYSFLYDIINDPIKNKGKNKINSINKSISLQTLDNKKKVILEKELKLNSPYNKKTNLPINYGSIIFNKRNFNLDNNYNNIKDKIVNKDNNSYIVEKINDENLFMDFPLNTDDKLNKLSENKIFPKLSCWKINNYNLINMNSCKCENGNNNI